MFLSGNKDDAIDAMDGFDAIAKKASSELIKLEEYSKNKVNQKATEINVAYFRTTSEISGRVARAHVRHQENVARAHRESADRRHTAAANALGFKEAAAGGVSSFFEGVAGVARKMEASAQENKNKRLRAVSTYQEVVQATQN